MLQFIQPCRIPAHDAGQQVASTFQVPGNQPIGHQFRFMVEGAGRQAGVGEPCRDGETDVGVQGACPPQKEKCQQIRRTDDTYEEQSTTRQLTPDKAAQERFQDGDHPADSDHRVGKAARVAEEEVKENGSD